MEQTPYTHLPFRKMHGLGNDFVVIDARVQDYPLTPAIVRAIGDRNRGVGFDQLVVLHKGIDADVNVTFWNSDGSIAGACGNASRCITRLMTAELGKSEVTLRTARGLLSAAEREPGVYSVNMGHPHLTWQDVPLAHEADLNALPLDGAPSAVGMGNPHCVYFVDDANTIDVPREGVATELNPFFPERTNVEFVHVLGENHLRQRTWERGGMETLACGSGACAVAVAAHRRGLVGRSVTIELDGGTLGIEWRDDGVWMTGPASDVFQGSFSPEFLATAHD